MKDGNAVPINKYFIRITYEKVGVYEKLKQHMTKTEWLQFKRSDACRWLPLPKCEYKSNYLSYFTEKGCDKFVELVMPYVIKHLDKNKLEIKKYKISLASIRIVYSDEYQIVTDGREKLAGKKL